MYLPLCGQSYVTVKFQWKKKHTPVWKNENPEFSSCCGKILVKKKHTPVCEIENPEFWSFCGKISVKKEHTPVWEIENPEFWSALKFRWKRITL